MIYHGDPDKIPMGEFAQEFHELANRLITEAMLYEGRNALAFLGGRVACLEMFLESIDQTEAFNVWIMGHRDAMPSEEIIRDNGGE